MNLPGLILVLSSLAVAWGVAMGDLRTNSSAEKSLPLSPSDGILSKTIFSSKLRLVFLVGLEGSGHHYIVSAFGHFADSGDGGIVKQEGCKLMFENLDVDNAMTRFPSYYVKHVEAARGRMQTLAQLETILRPDEALASLCGKYSYPRKSGNQKVYHYIDLRTLATLAEEANVDLRILYLKRSAKDMVISTTVHRHFHKSLALEDNAWAFMIYMRVLLTAISVMQAFLAGIDPAFVECHDFDYIGDVDQASRIADHLIPRKEHAERLAHELSRPAPTKHNDDSEEERFEFEGADLIVARLQLQLDSFESKYCGRKP